MIDIVAAIDETAANVIVPVEIAAQPPLTQSGSGPLGPFGLTYTATATISVPAGGVDFIPPPTDVIRLGNGRVNYSLGLNLSLDLSFLNFCLPQICVTLPFFGRVCTPKICFTFPTINVPVSHSGFVDFTVDLRLATALVAGNWEVNAVVVGVPSLVLGPAGALLIAAIGAAVTAALLLVPFIGPLLALASAIIFGAFTVANVLNLLGPIITPFVSGLSIPIYKAPQTFEMLAASGPDPAVNVLLTSVAAALDGSAGEDELVLSVEISP
jgi:hypothetical protein